MPHPIAPGPGEVSEHLRIDGCLVIGAGLAGLYLAIKLAPKPCLVISPRGPGAGAASAWAQGGVAAALGPNDTPDHHAQDTIAVGAGLVNEQAAHAICAQGAALVEDLARLGAPFDRDQNGAFALSREAAHSAARVARVKGDGAGRAIMKAVGQTALACDHVTVRAGLTAVRLLHRPGGAIDGCLAYTPDHTLVRITASDIVLAAGGVGALYDITTNPAEADGSAIALAARAGAKIADAEFVQFHPTALDVGQDPAPLATEALRGDGAVLVDRTGAPLTDPLGPRDVVARAVHQARQNDHGAYLDARTAIGDAFPDHYPAVFAACMAADIDPRTALIPVAPAAHYHMGGVMTDLNGATSLSRLWAVGEAGRTGMHGANRLASNSLLEAGVVARRAAQAIKDTRAEAGSSANASPPPAPRGLNPSQRAQLRAAMSAHASVSRSAVGLGALNDILCQLTNSDLTPNPVITAQLIHAAAAARTESRGAHARSDHPQRNSQPHITVLTWRSPDRIDTITREPAHAQP